MLQSFNDRLKGPFTWAVVISISVIFVISGMSFFFTGFGGSSSYVAKVGDNEISSQQFLQYSQNATTKEQKEQVLNQLVNQYLVLTDSQNHNIVVSQLALQSVIFTNPMFFDTDGKFSADKLKQVASYLGGMNKLEQILAQNIQSSLIPKTIVDTSFMTTYENKYLSNIYSVNKKIEYIKISPSDLEKDIKPSVKELESYYSDNKKDYVKPADKSISYFIISKDDFINKASISNKQVQSYYNTHKDLFDKFDNKTKQTIKKIIQNREALEHYNEFSDNVDSIKFSKLEGLLGKPKKINITDDLDSTNDVKNSLFFVSSSKYGSIPSLGNKLLVYQTDTFQKSAQQDFDNVKDKVRQAYISQKSQMLAVEKSQKLLDQLDSGNKIEQAFSTSTISDDSKTFSKAFNDYVLSNSNEEYHVYKNQNNEIYIYKVTKVEPKNNKDNSIPSQIVTAYKDAESNFYLQVIRKDIPVKVNYKNI